MYIGNFLTNIQVVYKYYQVTKIKDSVFSKYNNYCLIIILF